MLRELNDMTLVFLVSLFNSIPTRMSVHLEAYTLFVCLVSAGELEDQSVVLLILGSLKVSLHQSPQIKAASCLIHLLEYIASP